MQLSSILQQVATIPSQADCEVSRLIIDSRQITSGDVFIAMQGTQVDGRQYIAAAVKNGATAVLTDTQETAEINYQNNTPVIPVAKLKERLGDIASAFYGHPSQRMKMLAVTGTNGKTTCTHLMAQCFQNFNLTCGVIGTLGSGLYGALGEPGLTTPDPVTLHATLKDFVGQGAKATVMEVSSHSIDQGRVNGIPFESAIFTNLSQDHLDYHGNMQSYAAVKKRFLTDFPIKHLIVNTDDVFGRAWTDDLKQHPSVFAYGLQPKGELPDSIPYIHAKEIDLRLDGIYAQVVTPWGESELSLSLIGQFNLSNVLAVLTSLCLYGIPFADVLKLLSQLTAVPGRMQLLGGRDKPLVVVDYSHSPDSLEKALQALKLHTKGRLICVFGCGGNRDAAKRPLMAKVAEQLADRIIVTNDNPRHEDPADIARQIVAGLSRPDQAAIELDRSKAIEKSIQWASADDCILIAGKGAEHYQQIGDQKHPFDDVAQVSRYLKLAIE